LLHDRRAAAQTSELMPTSAMSLIAKMLSTTRKIGSKQLSSPLHQAPSSSEDHKAQPSLDLV